MSAEAIMVGVSGGVDSSVAAWLLAQAKQPVSGMFMKNWEEDDPDGTCPSAQDAEDAAAVCARIGIPFHARNFASEYWDGVFQHFIDEYQAGRTPNPDVLCNREIKFKTFIEHAEDLGADKIATGHYARVDALDGRYRLLRGRDQNKDQSYFLHAIGQDALSRTLFPVGELPKSEVRRIAAEAGLLTADKKDSTGICFIGERRFRTFLSRYVVAQAGEIQTPEGLCVGSHSGVCFYTIGQRDGLGIGGRRDAGPEPWYVVGKELQRNVLIAAQGTDHPLLFASRLQAHSITWVAGAAPPTPLRCHAKTRYRQPDQDCTVQLFGDGRLEVQFDSPQRAVTPGQSVVFYQGDECLGGAVIDRTDAVYGGWSGT
ncbi:MAG: tRNA 2-thiouridine(34) synthase MnmA [Pseudomonadota bacterium]|nr:tRNA 2-thiouridine(34) synthase MnmA [Pseudomonadota bacterium]